MSEHELQKEIIELLKKRGAVVIRVNSGNVSVKVKGAEKGTSDIIACYKSLFLAIEVKDIDGRVSMDQRFFQTHVLVAGGIYILAYRVSDVVDRLDEIDKPDYRII
jgi:hypothetical protein